LGQPALIVGLTTQGYSPVERRRSEARLRQSGRPRCQNHHVRRLLRQWFDPTESERVGTTPDYRFSLANERTFLAWIRTGLALIGGGLAVAAFVPPLRWPHVRETLAIGLLVLGAAVSLRAVDHWSRAERAMRLGQPLPPSRFPAALALLIGGGAVVLLVVIIASGLRQ
jgi:putative membrane protein